jgi:hypothetical protein
VTARQRALRIAYLRGSVLALSLFTFLMLLSTLADRVTN